MRADGWTRCIARSAEPTGCGFDADEPDLTRVQFAAQLARLVIVVIIPAGRALTFLLVRQLLTAIRRRPQMVIRRRWHHVVYQPDRPVRD